jgi:hypothetical protein
MDDLEFKEIIEKIIETRDSALAHTKTPRSQKKNAELFVRSIVSRKRNGI